MNMKSLIKILPLILLSIISACGGGGGGGGSTPPDGPSALDYGSASANLSRGFTITPLTPTFTGTADAFAITAGSLPSGLSIDATSGVISGAPTTLQSAALLTVTASLTGGTSDTFDITFTVTAPSMSALFTLSPLTGVIGIHTIDPATGALNVRGDIAGLNSPNDLVLTPDTDFLYVVHIANSTIAAYDVDAGTGDLTELAASPFSMQTTPSLPNRLAVSPDGTTLYSANRGDNSISLFTIGAAGDLTEKAASPFGSFNTAYDLTTVSIAGGDFLYLTAIGEATNRLMSFSIAANGDLTNIDMDTAGNNPTVVQATFAGDFLYVANESDGTVSSYAIGADGTLTELASSPTAISASGDFLRDMTIAEDGTLRSLYVASTNGTVSQFAIAANGALSLLTPDSISTAGASARGLAASPDGGTLYSCDAAGFEIDSYTVGVGGALGAQVDMPRIRTTAGMTRALVLPSAAAPTWTTTSLYAAATSANTLNYFSIETDGSMTSGVPFATGVSLAPSSITVSKTGDNLYVTHPGDASAPLMRIPLLATGAPNIGGAAATSGNNASFFALDHNSEFLYVVDAPAKTLRGFPLASTGAIGAPGATKGLGNLPFDVSIDPSGRFIYVPNLTDGNISQFRIDPVSGAIALASPASTLAPVNPTSVTVHPSGRHVYVTAVGISGLSGDSIAMYHINKDTGSLTSMATPLFTTGIDPLSIAITPDGNFAVIANSGDNTITTHAINNLQSDATEDGLLGPTLSTGATTAIPRHVSISADGKTVYVGINVGAAVEAFSMDASGMLSSLDAEVISAGTSSVALRETRQ